MTAPDLPAELKAALDAKLQGVSRNDAAERAALISQTYRDGGGSSAIRSAADALAYALARMPATYAAVSASLNALREIRPDFAPTNLLDVGAGPGTATWAAAAAFPSLTSLALLDSNSALPALALDLGGGSTRVPKMTYQHSEDPAALADSEKADLVIARFKIGEDGRAASCPRDCTAGCHQGRGHRQTLHGSGNFERERSPSSKGSIPALQENRLGRRNFRR